MTDLEIYSFTSDILYSITRDLSEDIYTKLEGNLTFSWNTEPRISAWAESKGDINHPPQHEIVICYELARQLYRDAENYHEFQESELLEDLMKLAFKDFNPKPELPRHLNTSNSIKNMYIAAITWVFFHELGHLMQEHGYIRSIYNSENPKIRIEDCESNGQNILTGQAAIVSHVTEFAADVEATQWCVEELIRHFLPTLENVTEESKKDFKNNLFLLVCGISCTFYRFYGERPVEPEEYPDGSHPTPIRRLEMCIPNIFEKLDFNGHGEKLHGLNRKSLVYLCIGAAESSGFFWLWRYSEGPKIPDHFFSKGVIQDPYRTLYWSKIIEMWDEIEPNISKIRRFGSKLGILYFTDWLRSEVFEDKHPSSNIKN